MGQLRHKEAKEFSKATCLCVKPKQSGHEGWVLSHTALSCGALNEKEERKGKGQGPIIHLRIFSEPLMDSAHEQGQRQALSEVPAKVWRPNSGSRYVSSLRQPHGATTAWTQKNCDGGISGGKREARFSSSCLRWLRASWQRRPCPSLGRGLVFRELRPGRSKPIS